MSTPTIVVIGPLPPPAYGVATATKLMLDSAILTSSFRLLHVDTSDRRGLANMGRIDLMNVLLAIKHEAVLVGHLVRHRPAVVYLTLSQAPAAILRDWVLLRTAVMFGSSPVTHLRASGYDRLFDSGPAWLRWVMRDVFARSARILVLGAGLVEMAKAIDPVARVDVAPNGCRALRATALGCLAGEHVSGPVVAFLGIVAESKGVFDVLEAASAVVRRVPTARFIFAGEWGSAADRQRAEMLVRSGQLEDNVEFAGSLGYDAKVELLGRARTLVLASHSEGQPWTILEAMSMGLPVVATATGAVPDMVVDGVTGRLVQVGDVESIAAALTAMLIDDEEAASMGARGRERFEQSFTVEKSHQAFARVLVEVCRDRD